MITSTIKNLPKSTVELEIKIPWSDTKETYETLLNKAIEEIEVSGFRKGKAPKKIAEKNINQTKLYENVMREVIPKGYDQALKEHQLKPITTPKIELVNAKENEDWVVRATVVQMPKIELGNYKEKIRELKKTKTKIWTPKSGEGNKEEEKLKIDEIVNVLVSEVKIELSDLLIEQEANKLLSDLIDQTQKLGLTIEQYLTSKGLTSEQLRADYTKQAYRNLTLELALSEVAEKENITVTQQDIDAFISKLEKDEDKEKLKKNSYFLARLLRQQKTLDFLANL